MLKIILFGSHARDDWVEAPKEGYFSDYDLLIIVNAAEALERIAGLYAIEKETHGSPPGGRVAVRQETAPSRCSKICSDGPKPAWPGFPANRRWPRLFAMPSRG